MEPINPVTFWALACLTLLLLGAVIHREVNSWWLRWQASRRDEKLRNSPSVMRQRIKDYEATNDKLMSEIDGLKLELAEARADKIALEDEVRRLVDRNTFLSNETRSDPSAKTLVYNPSMGSYRWTSRKD